MCALALPVGRSRRREAIGRRLAQFLCPMMEVPEKLVEMMASGRPLTSLSLSGQFKSRTTLGNSLSRCTSLTALDLSRNALTTLDGLQSLRALTKLNCYYNAISNLDELRRLRHHPALTILDLRLNPVPHEGPRVPPADLDAALCTSGVRLASSRGGDAPRARPHERAHRLDRAVGRRRVGHGELHRRRHSDVPARLVQRGVAPWRAQVGACAAPLPSDA